jgi:hypothetical protein
MDRDLLYEWEVEFLHSLSTRVFNHEYPLTDRQEETLDRLIDDVGKRGKVTAKRIS